MGLPEVGVIWLTLGPSGHWVGCRLEDQLYLATIRGAGMRKTLLLCALFTVSLLGVWGQNAKPQPDKNGVYAAWNGVKAASLVHAVPATAPDDSKLEGQKYVCALLVEVGEDGVPKRIAVANKAASPFDKAAIFAVQKSQFEPGSFNGNPVPTLIVVGTIPWKRSVGCSGKRLVEYFDAAGLSEEFEDPSASEYSGGGVFRRSKAGSLRGHCGVSGSCQRRRITFQSQDCGSCRQRAG